MKKLTTFFEALLLLTLMVGCHRSQADRYQERKIQRTGGNYDPMKEFAR